MANERRASKVVDCPDIREIFSDRVVCSHIGGGALIITLGCNRFTPEQTDQQPKQFESPPVHVNNRIALSLPAAVELINSLRNLLTAAQQAAQKQAATPREGDAAADAAARAAAAVALKPS